MYINNRVGGFTFLLLNVMTSVNSRCEITSVHQKTDHN